MMNSENLFILCRVRQKSGFAGEGLAGGNFLGFVGKVWGWAFGVGGGR